MTDAIKKNVNDVVEVDAVGEECQRRAGARAARMTTTTRTKMPSKKLLVVLRALEFAGYGCVESGGGGASTTITEEEEGGEEEQRDYCNERR